MLLLYNTWRLSDSILYQTLYDCEGLCRPNSFSSIISKQPKQFSANIAFNKTELGRQCPSQLSNKTLLLPGALGGIEDNCSERLFESTNKEVLYKTMEEQNVRGTSGRWPFYLRDDGRSSFLAAQDALGGLGCKTFLFAQISPEAGQTENVSEQHIYIYIIYIYMTYVA